MSVERFMFGENEQSIIEELSDNVNLYSFDTAEIAHQNLQSYSDLAKRSKIFKLTVHIEEVTVEKSRSEQAAIQSEAKTQAKTK